MPTSSVRAYLTSLEQIGIKLGLDQIRALVARLDRPDRASPTIVVAGTNGKGSVTAMVERGLRAAGYRTGRYTSPHLIHLEERFAIDGEPVGAAALDAALERVREAAADLPAPPSFFEATTAAGLELFRHERVDVAVLEVGLGGRLDATNVVTQTATAITAIDFDHEQYLGHTLELIAAEKAGVIKPGGLVVLAPNPPVVREVVDDVCTRAGAILVNAGDAVTVDAAMRDGETIASFVTPRARYTGLTLALRGRHQVDNAMTAIRLLEELTATGRVVVPRQAIVTALTETVWPARLELMRRPGGGARDVLIDGAHNPAGARALAAYLNEAYGRRVPMVVGAMRDKQIDALLAALAAAASSFFFTAAGTPRAARASDLVAMAREVAPDVPAIDAGSPSEALARATAAGSPVVIAGSLYLCGELRAELS